jgi:GT2 family glycosyltransferase
VKHGVYIATKNRENDVFDFLDSLILNSSDFELILIDSTEPKIRFDAFQETLRDKYPTLRLKHIFHKGRLPSARNAGLNLNLQHDLIHFFDDDVTLPDDYFEKIENFLRGNPEVMGGGPRIKNLYLPNLNSEKNYIHEVIRKLKNFRLNIIKYGIVNSGCKHYWIPDRPQTSCQVDWIPGCSMFFRPEVFEKFRFNEFMENGFSSYAFGEDLEFTFRASREFKFMAVDTTVIEHHLAPSPRSDLFFIASCSGATTAHLYSMFPKHFSRLRIYIEKVPEFLLKCAIQPKHRVKLFVGMCVRFDREFKREIREQNWRISQNLK